MDRKTIFYVLLAAVIIAVLAGLFASNYPDGLEKAAKSLGFVKKASGSPAIFIDYQLPAFPVPAISSIAAGIVGILVIIFIFKSISKARHIGEFLKNLLKND